MRRCDRCDIGFSGDLSICPLCHAELVGEAEPAVFPRNRAKESGSMALKVLAFATGVCLLLMLLLWQLHSLPGDVIVVVCLALAMNYLYVRNVLIHSPNFLRVVIRYFLILLAIAFAGFLVTGDRAITTYVIPGICLVALVFDAVLIVVFRGTFVSGYAKYLLFDVFLGLTPLVLVALGLTTWSLLAYLSAFTASVFFLALAIFMRKELVEELHKLFSP